MAINAVIDPPKTTTTAGTDPTNRITTSRTNTAAECSHLPHLLYLQYAPIKLRHTTIIATVTVTDATATNTNTTKHTNGTTLVTVVAVTMTVTKPTAVEVVTPTTDANTDPPKMTMTQTYTLCYQLVH